MVILRQVMAGLPEWSETPEGAVCEMNEAKNPASLFSNQQIEIKGALDIPVTGVAYDSRQVTPGSIFVCIRGLKADGHDFAEIAVERGAAVLVVERFLELPATQVKVPDARRALGLISAAFLGWPANKLRMIGVTGTNGKTTTTSLIENMFNRAGRPIGLIGTLGARIGDTEFPGSRTTPEASDLQALLAEMVSRQAGYAVMEVSSHALDLHRVAGVEYDVAVFTNLTQDHLDFHGDMAEYLAAKAKLFKGLGHLVHKEGKKYAVINLDDPAGSQLVAATQVKTVTYGIKHAADYRAENILNRPTGVEFDAVFPGGTIRLALKTPGMFTVYNSLAAFAVGVEEGLKPEMAATALAEIKGVPGRFEPVEGDQPFSVIVDYAHTPDSLENVLRTAREFVKGRIIAVFGCGGDRDKTKRPVMGEIAGRLADLPVVTSDNPRTEDPGVIIEEVKAGLARVAVNYLAEQDRHQAIMLACTQAKPGDMVLIAGKGHEDYQEINGVKYPFDDRVVARECLGRLGYGTHA